MKLLIIIYLYFINEIESYDFEPSMLYRMGRMIIPDVVNTNGAKEAWFQQKLDHYNNSNTETWKQRYFLNFELSDENVDGPVFLTVGGEDESSINWMKTGAWYYYAQKYQAKLFMLEHRFYGKSRPTKDVSTDSLRYLHSTQALEDLKYFITQMKIKYNIKDTNKWILFGGSYPANLATWSRYYYPNLVYGSIASSGPLEAKVNFAEFNDIVKKDLNDRVEDCGNQVTKAVQEVQTLLSTSDGFDTLNEKFNVCSDFDTTNQLNRGFFIFGLVGPITAGAQSDGAIKNGLDVICKYMSDKSLGQPIDRLSHFLQHVNGTCKGGNYEIETSYYLKNDWDSNTHGLKQWSWQSCNEFGYFQTSETKTSLASDALPLQLDLQKCHDVFGFTANQVNRNIATTNARYKGRKINVTRVVFIQNSVDPWHPLGMVINNSTSSPLLYVQGTSHCYDMLYPSDSDNDSLKAARSITEKYLDEWLDYQQPEINDV